MKQLALAFMLFSLLGISAFGQSNRSTRPRVAPTPSPKPVPDVIYEDDSDAEKVRERPTLRNNKETATREVPAKDSPTEVGDDDDIIRVETNLVTVPVSVLDRNGRFISGLGQSDFRIFEENTEQKIGFFQSIEQPFTVVLMIDVSPSTSFQMNEIQDAAITFVDQLRPADRVMVVTFDERVRIQNRPTSDRNELRRAIMNARQGNGTSLYGAVDQVFKAELSKVQGRKAIVLFTDGVDTTSRRASYDTTLRDAEETDVVVYPIRYNTLRDYGASQGGGVYRTPRNTGGILGGILGTIITGGNVQIGGRRGGGGGRGAGTSSSEYAVGRKYLETLAENSGGRSFEADTLSNLESAFSGIAEELRRQYYIGYYPDETGQAGERKRIRVRVMRPNLVVRAKTSYIVGAGSANASHFAGR
ncbi:MAG: VWA domain-containing protein [Acidobacteria bacterium]|nr:VWA domain-containing protein [Acidobacteriota bacterium]